MHRFAGIILLAAVMVVAAVYAFVVTPTTRPPATEAQAPAAPQPAQPQSAGVPIGKGFDFYVLALSWSPSYCLSEAGAGNRQQCGDGKDYGMIVHGLWPQNEKGYPADCTSTEPERVPERLGRTLLDIMPGMGLIGHEWRKHGTCSGLSQADYFRVTRSAFERVTIPAQFRAVASPTKIPVADIERQFTAANPGLTGKGVAVTCEEGRLDEVRICLSKDLQFRACPEVDRQSCPIPSVAVPATN